MLDVDLDRERGIAVLCPHGALTEQDFIAAADIIDPYIEGVGKLNGLIITTQSFPGWDSFTAMMKHLTFVKCHHQKIKRVALVSDSIFAGLAENVGSHFVAAEIKHFEYNKFSEAQSWVLDKAKH